MSRLRYLLTQATLRGLAWFSRNGTAIHVENDLYHTKIFSGPLRGMSFSMPRLERAAYALGTYERHVVNTIATYVKTNDVAYDIGANAGYLTLVLAKLVGTQGKVFAFEPDPKNFKALKLNLERNAMAQVTAVAKAVSSETGTVTFASYEYSLVGHIAGENTPGDAKLHQVAAISLDDFIFVENQPQPSFIKIDVEGAEEQVLRGATRVLQEVRPVILAEVRSGPTWQHISELMNQCNYDIQLLSGGWKMGKDYLGDVLFVPVGRVG